MCVCVYVSAGNPYIKVYYNLPSLFPNYREAVSPCALGAATPPGSIAPSFALILPNPYQLFPQFALLHVQYELVRAGHRAI